MFTKKVAALDAVNDVKQVLRKSAGAREFHIRAYHQKGLSPYDGAFEFNVKFRDLPYRLIDVHTSLIGNEFEDFCDTSNVDDKLVVFEVDVAGAQEVEATQAQTHSWRVGEDMPYAMVVTRELMNLFSKKIRQGYRPGAKVMWVGVDLDDRPPKDYLAIRFFDTDEAVAFVMQWFNADRPTTLNDIHDGIVARRQ